MRRQDFLRNDFDTGSPEGTATGPLVVVDADRQLIGRMHVESQRVNAESDRAGMMVATYTSTGV